MSKKQTIKELKRQIEELERRVFILESTSNNYPYVLPVSSPTPKPSPYDFNNPIITMTYPTTTY